MPVLMTTVAETNKIDCFLMGDSSSLALQGETPRELVQFRRGSFGWGREACDHMPLMDRKRELRQRWQRAAQLILAKADVVTVSRSLELRPVQRRRVESPGKILEKRSRDPSRS
jgi:hypothetical protein